MEIKQFIATKAFIVHQGKILIVRESNKYSEGTNLAKYDLPGGRLKPGENFKEALIREVREETGLRITIGQPLYVGEWRPTVKGEPWQIVGVFFICQADNDQVILGEDHDDFKWIDPKKYGDYPLIDKEFYAQPLKPIFEAYLNEAR